LAKSTALNIRAFALLTMSRVIQLWCGLKMDKSWIDIPETDLSRTSKAMLTVWLEKKKAVETPEPPPPKEAEKDQPVVELTKESFLEEIKSGITFVEFYSPWCGHCKRLAQTWELLGKKFLNRDGIKIAKIDCTQTDNREFCNEQEIEGFPSLFLYKDGQKISEYRGSRELDDLYDFVNSHSSGHDEL